MKHCIICILFLIAGICLGYAYGFGAKNRPIKKFEFWFRCVPRKAGSHYTIV